MTKEEMDQLIDLRQEIKELEKQIESLRNKKIGTTLDRVKSSYNSFPYIEGSATISGYNYREDIKRNNAIENKINSLVKRRKKAAELEQRITEYIETVDDSKIRRIMEYRYIQGYKWEKIAELLHCDRTAPNKIITKYLNTHPEIRKK